MLKLSSWFQQLLLSIKWQATSSPTGTDTQTTVSSTVNNQITDAVTQLHHPLPTSNEQVQEAVIMTESTKSSPVKKKTTRKPKSQSQHGKASTNSPKSGSTNTTS